MFTRLMRQEDIPQVMEWLRRIKDANLLDEDVLSYDTTNILCMYERNGAATKEPKLYVPVQTVYMLESLAPHPNLSPADFSRAIRDAVKAVSFEASRKGVGEIWFGSRDDNVNRLALMHGFEKVEYPLHRMKV